jgi:carbonic anhydrase
VLAKYLDVESAALDVMAITEPRKAVLLDIAALKTRLELPDGLMLSGLVYDVKTGLVETVAAPAPLRTPAA